MGDAMSTEANLPVCAAKIVCALYIVAWATMALVITANVFAYAIAGEPSWFYDPYALALIMAILGSLLVPCAYVVVEL